MNSAAIYIESNLCGNIDTTVLDPFDNNDRWA